MRFVNWILNYMGNEFRQWIPHNEWPKINNSKSFIERSIEYTQTRFELFNRTIDWFVLYSTRYLSSERWMHSVIQHPTHTHVPSIFFSKHISSVHNSSKHISSILHISYVNKRKCALIYIACHAIENCLFYSLSVNSKKPSIELTKYKSCFSISFHSIIIIINYEWLCSKQRQQSLFM